MDRNAAGVIVVGVDATEAAGDALRWALAEARQRQAILRAVYACRFPVAGGRGYIPPELLDRDTLREKARHVLDAAVDAAVGESPDVEIERVVAEGSAARVLVDAARGADMLVVGSRGHSGVAALLLDSVAASCLHSATCPVVIVPPHRRRRER